MQHTISYIRNKINHIRFIPYIRNKQVPYIRNKINHIRFIPYTIPKEKKNKQGFLQVP